MTFIIATTLLENIRSHLNYDKPIKLPALLFFQVESEMITDYFFVKLEEQKIEEGFNEIKKYLKHAVDDLGKVSSENKQNSAEVFDILKRSIDAAKFEKTANDIKKAFLSKC